MSITRQEIIDIFTAIKTATEGTLTVGLPTGAATEAKQDTLIAKDFATETTLDAVKTAVEGANAMELYGADAGKAAITPTVTGVAYIAIDTKLIYLWDGLAWVEFIDLS